MLPWSSYRAPEWNAGRPVLDPLPRFLTRDTVVSGDLVVSGVRIEGEDPRGPQVAAALASPTPQSRSRALADLGVRWVATEKDAGPAPSVSGTVLHDGPLLRVDRLAGPVQVPRVSTGRLVAVVAAWAAYAAFVLAGLVVGVISGARIVRSGRPTRFAGTDVDEISAKRR